MSEQFERTGEGRLDAGDVTTLQMIAAGAPLSDVLDTLVRVIEQSADGMLGSILLVDDGVRLRHGAAPHLPRAYIDAIDGELIGPAAGSCGTAAFRRETVIVEDVMTDPLWHAYREAAGTFGFRACWSVPIFGADRSVLGTFALYHQRPRAPTPELLEVARRATHLASIAIDRHRREQALVASEARARLVVENALDANVIMGSDGMITAWSVRARETFGWSAEEAVGRRLSDLVIPARDRAQHERGLSHYAATGVGPLLGRRIEVYALHRDGHEFPVELAIAPINVSNRVAFSAFIRDITSRKRAEEALRESEQHLSLVYDHVADVLFHILVEPDGEFRFVSMNPEFFRVTGLTPEQVNGKLVREVIPEPSLTLVLAKYQEAIRAGHTVRWDETTLYPSGSRHGEVSVTPVYDALGRAKSIIGSVRDVTDRKRIEDEMRQLQKMEAIGRMAGGIAHDFNNILGVILMRAYMLAQDLDDPAQREEIDEIVKAGERGAGLTKQFLAFSRKQVLRPEVIDLNGVVTNVRSILRPLIGEDIDFTTVLAHDPWRVEADPGQIEQVIMNLVINAKQAMPDGGKLTIETANVALDEEAVRLHLQIEPGEYAMLAVSDTGCGMNEEVRRRLFEPFFTTKEPGKGTGLGLATVYGIVKQSRGDIWVHSVPDHGSSFKVYLPRTSAEPVPKVEQRLRRPSGKQVLGHVLVVEDESALRESFARLLPQLRCGVTVAANPGEARALVEEGLVPDLLLTDIVMPGGSGKDLAAHLCKRLPGLRVVFISGYPDSAIAHHGVLEPGTPFLQKPFSITELASVLEHALDIG